MNSQERRGVGRVMGEDCCESKKKRELTHVFSVLPKNSASTELLCGLISAVGPSSSLKHFYKKHVLSHAWCALEKGPLLQFHDLL